MTPNQPTIENSSLFNVSIDVTHKSGTSTSFSEAWKEAPVGAILYHQRMYLAGYGDFDYEVSFFIKTSENTVILIKKI